MKNSGHKRNGEESLESEEKWMFNKRKLKRMNEESQMAARFVQLS